MHAIQLDIPAPLSRAPLAWREVPDPEPGPGQLLVQVAACGVCRSNLHMIEGDWVDSGVPGRSPIVPGHEVTGTVVALGMGVDGFARGDRVGVQPLWWTCGTCEYCTSGREQLCHDRLITGEHVDGGYAELMVANAAHTYHVPDALDLVEAAPLFCPGITAFAAVEKAGLRPGDRVAIFGLGGVGHMAVQFARLRGAEVVAVGRNSDHLQVARELGASHLVDASRIDPGEVLEDSVDAAVTFAPSDVVTAQALRALRWGGTLVSAVPLNITGFPFNREQVVKASLLGNRDQMTEVLRLAAAGQVRTVVDRFPLAEVARALEELAAGRLRSRAVLETASAVK
ncbi:alcohol dehydrogenase catalytic domain-containing protein [Promicromonospora sp. NPDC090134]|uniref:alcohol dehydrogenase catalytic domain-containing protein n=1 Tax=Promicromonospora sp. NPDC090134 TaxID=3364408 RepID=UPI0038247346